MGTKQDWHLPTISEEYNALCRLSKVDVKCRVALGEIKIMASAGTLIAYEIRPKAMAIQIHEIISVSDNPDHQPDVAAAHQFIDEESKTWQCPTIFYL